jgi:hypothetical protein
MTFANHLSQSLEIFKLISFTDIESAELTSLEYWNLGRLVCEGLSEGILLSGDLYVTAAEGLDGKWFMEILRFPKD